MSRIRGKNTKPEMALRTALWSIGLRYRLHVAVPGRPDIVFVRRRLAVFVDGCFWHGCPEHAVRPKTNAAFWTDKLAKNIARDRKTTALLEADGWTVLRFWEHDIKRNIVGVVEKVTDALEGGEATGCKCTSTKIKDPTG